MKPVQPRDFLCYCRQCCFAWICFLSLYNCAEAQQDRKHKHDAQKGKTLPARTISIEQQLGVFDDSADALSYTISLCADVPLNKKPHKVAHKQQTGHVFLILQKVKKAGDTIQRVFGYYPKKGLSTLLFKKVKSCIKDNSQREYDTKISRAVSRQQFDTVIAKCIFLASRPYHINKFNCYDYAVGVFNSVAPDHPLPVTYVRFPFPFGKGGSPCSVYRDFKKMKDSGAFWANSILVGTGAAPVSTGRLE
jgi:hypothetical protein